MEIIVKVTIKSVFTAEILEKVETSDYMNYLKSISEKYLIENIVKYNNTNLIDVYVTD